MNLRNLAIWGAILIAAALIYGVMQGQTHGGAAVQDLSYSDLLTRIDSGDIAEATIAGAAIDAVDKHNTHWRVVGPTDSDTGLVQELKTHNVHFQFGRPGPNLFIQFLLQ